MSGANKFSLALVLAFCTAVIVIATATLKQYPGKPEIYILFTIVINAYLLMGLSKKKIFFDVIMSAFIWLGFWLKFSVRIGYFNAKFVEQIGNFDRSPAAYDKALLVTIVAVCAFIIAKFFREKFIFDYTKYKITDQPTGIYSFYLKYRKTCLTVVGFLVLTLVVLNAIFHIYQRGTVNTVTLPFGLNSILTWLLLFGFTSFFAVILHAELMKKTNPYIVMLLSLSETFFSNVSMLSRGMIINASTIIYSSYNSQKHKKKNFSIPFIICSISAFLILFVSSIVVVQKLRSSRFLEGRQEIYFQTEEGKKRWIQDQTGALFIDRWVGMEGVMAVSSYPNLGWDLWNEAWQERSLRVGTSLYDKKIIDSPYLFLDLTKHHFISLPGLIAFLYYPGSMLFLFSAVFILSIFAASIELAAFRLSGNNMIFGSLIAQVLAMRYAHFGYAPAQSYLLLGAIVMNVGLVFFISYFLKYRKKEIV